MLRDNQFEVLRMVVTHKKSYHQGFFYILLLIAELHLQPLAAAENLQKQPSL